MQSDSLSAGTRSNKSIGLHAFNALVLLFIVYLQFQNILGVPIKENMPRLSHAIFLVDKIFLFSLFLLFIYIRLLGGLLAFEGQRVKRFGFWMPLKSELMLLISLAIFGIWCLISTGVNQNSLKPTIFGTFAYMVYFLVFFVFSSIPYNRNLIKKNYIFLLNLALFLSAISVFQEILALTYPSSIHWWPNILSGQAVWRLGLFRAPSLLGHPNGIGMFALFFFTVELARTRESGLKQNWLKFTLLGLAILFSLSRAAMGGAFIALFFLLPAFRRILILFLPVIALAGALLFNQLKSAFLAMEAGAFDYDRYRAYVLEKSFKVFNDHPLFGVGPGMYGGHISIKYESPIYSRYGFRGQYFDYLRNKVGSIEQQWMQVLAELGIPGMFFFIFLMLTPIFILYTLLTAVDDPLLKALIVGLMVMPLQMGFYMLGFTVSQQQEWLFPYFAFIGMLVGAQRKGKE